MYGDLILPNGRHVTMSQPFAVTVGGAGGPRIVTSTFSGDGGPRGASASFGLSADLDAGLYQAESDMWRRTAHALVGPAKRAAAQIGSGAITLHCSRGHPDWLTVGALVVERYEGLARVIRLTGSYRAPEEAGDEVPVSVRADWRDHLVDIADGLHRAASDRGFQFVHRGRPLVVPALSERLSPARARREEESYRREQRLARLRGETPKPKETT